ncbi:uncharacterized protein OCT59_027272 [Rhizophagus irregularis]|uniref:uncharacterized protein n=1 Tax=Rhizophagus irregularis TaxID=588596 RepID=UPI000CAB950F|nr:hypothetical protein OCT59_027272 [Rhizophagus irregularis]
MTKRKKRRRNEKRCLKEDLVKRRPRQREDRPKKKDKKNKKKTPHTHTTHTPNHIPKIPKGRRKKKGLRDRRPNKEKPRQREDGPRKRRR